MQQINYQISDNAMKHIKQYKELHGLDTEEEALNTMLKNGFTVAFDDVVA